MSSADNMKSFKTHLNEAMDRPPKWKKDTSDGEGGAQIIEFPKTKAKYRVSKSLMMVTVIKVNGR